MYYKTFFGVMKLPSQRKLALAELHYKCRAFRVSWLTCLKAPHVVMEREWKLLRVAHKRRKKMRKFFENLDVGCESDSGGAGSEI